MFRFFECCALSFFERFVLFLFLKIERFVSDSAEIWICGLYNLFFGTGIPAAIAIFNKGKKTDNVLFIDASREYENGKNQNKLRLEDISHIVSVYQQFTAGQLEPGVAEEKYAFVATPADIQENDYNLNIPRYVDTFEEEAEVDIPAVQKEIDALEAELAEVQAKMGDYLKDLGY